MTIPAKSLNNRYSFKDYQGWPDDERWEIIDGRAYCMTPAPTLRHQRILGMLHVRLEENFRGTPCLPFVAPVDVVFDDYNVVQPDIAVVCDKSKLTEANVQGAPDLVVEIISPSTSLKDRREKKALYERSGVREYLLVYPLEDILERYRLIGSRYEGPDLFNWDETLTLHAFPELTLNLWEIFEKSLPGEAIGPPAK